MPILEELDKVMKETENEIMKGVTDEEREVVKRVSGKMWDNLNRLLENKQQMKKKCKLLMNVVDISFFRNSIV